MFLFNEKIEMNVLGVICRHAQLFDHTLGQGSSPWGYIKDKNWSFNFTDSLKGQSFDIQRGGFCLLFVKY